MEIDQPEVVAEVRAAFDRYEKALVTNEVATLDDTFHNDPRTIRYGIGENLYGYDEIAAFRGARLPVGLMRSISRTVITTYGRDFAVASTLFQRTPGKTRAIDDDPQERAGIEKKSHPRRCRGRREARFENRGEPSATRDGVRRATSS